MHTSCILDNLAKYYSEVFRFNPRMHTSCIAEGTWVGPDDSRFNPRMHTSCILSKRAPCTSAERFNPRMHTSCILALFMGLVLLAVSIPVCIRVASCCHCHNRLWLPVSIPVCIRVASLHEGKITQEEYSFNPRMHTSCIAISLRSLEYQSRFNPRMHTSCIMILKNYHN